MSYVDVPPAAPGWVIVLALVVLGALVAASAVMLIEHHDETSCMSCGTFDDVVPDADLRLCNACWARYDDGDLSLVASVPPDGSGAER